MTSCVSIVGWAKAIGVVGDLERWLNGVFLTDFLPSGDGLFLRRNPHFESRSRRIGIV